MKAVLPEHSDWTFLSCRVSKMLKAWFRVPKILALPIHWQPEWTTYSDKYGYGISRLRSLAFSDKQNWGHSKQLQVRPPPLTSPLPSQLHYVISGTRICTSSGGYQPGAYRNCYCWVCSSPTTWCFIIYWHSDASQVGHDHWRIQPSCLVSRFFQTRFKHA